MRNKHNRIFIRFEYVIEKMEQIINGLRFHLHEARRNNLPQEVCQIIETRLSQWKEKLQRVVEASEKSSIDWFYAERDESLDLLYEVGSNAEDIKNFYNKYLFKHEYNLLCCYNRAKNKIGSNPDLETRISELLKKVEKLDNEMGRLYEELVLAWFANAPDEEIEAALNGTVKDVTQK